jgi:4a-hydroxytetrahydrobiopterin dehydratase
LANLAMLQLPRQKEQPTMSQTKERTYADAEIPAKLQENGLSDWYLEDGWLRRKYNTAGWPVTLMLVNAIGYICEAADHHADLAVTYAKLWVKLKTHSAGGITDKDFALAKKIEETVLWRPPAGGALKGTSDPFVYSKK